MGQDYMMNRMNKRNRRNGMGQDYRMNRMGVPSRSPKGDLAGVVLCIKVRCARP